MTNQASEDELEQYLLNDKAFQHILKFAPSSQRELMTFELARYINALIRTQKRLYAESEKLKELNRVYFEAMANSRENLLERILQRMKFCEEELGSAESED